MNLITNNLQKVANAVTRTQPAMVLGGFAGEPNYISAWKGQKSTDEVWWSGNGGGAGSISGTTTDTAPALAILDVFLTQTLYLAWKVAGSNTVKVLQYVLGEDGFPLVGGEWKALPTAPGQSSNPTASTDAAPALAVGANNQLYLVWKTPGDDAPLECSVYNGTEWSTPEVLPTAKTNTNPALAAWNTSGPGPVLPLCLAWKGATTDDVFWALYTPGSSTLNQNHVLGASTDAAPALVAGPVPAGKSYYVVWKGKGDDSLSFASISGETVGVTYTLPQVQTNLGPAAVDSSNNTSGFGAQVFNNLTLSWTDKTTGEVWTGNWAIVPNPAPFPGAGTDFGRTPDQGSNNYIFYRSTDCKLLNKVVVTIDVTEDLNCPQGFSFQLNANSPTSAKNYSRCSWQQCGFQLDSHGNLTSWVNNWINDKKYTIDTIGQTNAAGQEENLLKQWSKPTIPAGCTLTIALQYDHDLTVTSAVFTVDLPDGGGTPNNKIDYASNLAISPERGLVATDYLAPISVLQLVIVGFDNKADADFKSGAGTITVSAADPLIAGDSRPSCANDIATLEQSNILYGVLSATPSVSLTQTFCASYSKN